MLNDFWTFLNCNASAVQAAAAIATVFATIILVIITVRYVKLTGELAKTAREQMVFLHAGVSARQREYLSLIRLLKLQISALPSDKSDAETIRSSTTIDNNDLSQLQKLAAEIDQKSGQRAATAVNALRFLSEQIEIVKATNPRIGVDWGVFPWEEWTENLRIVQDRLEKLWETATIFQ